MTVQQHPCTGLLEASQETQVQLLQQWQMNAVTLPSYTLKHDKHGSSTQDIHYKWFISSKGSHTKLPYQNYAPFQEEILMREPLA